MASAPEKDQAPVSDEKPTDAVLRDVLKQQVKDKDGKAHSIESLLNDGSAGSRTVLVFIRHFYCSFCQEYVRTLSKDLPPSKLFALSPPTKLVIIGHGEPALIERYAERTGSVFSIYTEPTRAVYERLGFTVNLDGIAKAKPDHIRRGMLRLAWDTISGYVFGGANMFGSGKVDQNGGELIFTADKLDFIHRMKDTADHVGPKDLEAILTV